MGPRRLELLEGKSAYGNLARGASRDTFKNAVWIRLPPPPLYIVCTKGSDRFRRLLCGFVTVLGRFLA